jgi:hypothetical protein
MRLKTGLSELLRVTRQHSDEQKAHLTYGTLEEIDVFVLSYVTLGFREFLQRFRRDDVWRAVSTPQSEGRKSCPQV